jgi:hypothetical protein
LVMLFKKDLRTYTSGFSTFAKTMGHTGVSVYY